MIMISSCSFYGVTDRKNSEASFCILHYTTQNTFSQTSDMLPKSELDCNFCYHKPQTVFIFSQANNLLFLVGVRKFWGFWCNVSKKHFITLLIINCHISPKITALMEKLSVFSQAKLPKQGSAYLQLVKVLKSVCKENRHLSIRF